MLPDPIWPVVVLALIEAVDAALCWKPVGFIATCLTNVRFPRRGWRWLTPLKLAAAVGLVAGIWLPSLGLLTAVALVAYFVVAVTMHVRARDLGRDLFVNATGMLLICFAVLVFCFLASVAGVDGRRRRIGWAGTTLSVSGTPPEESAMLPSDGDMSGFLAQAQAMQQQLLQAQQELAETEMTGTSGGDLVEATVTGTGELVGLVIKPEAVDPEDTETLADLVLAAVRDANNKVQAVTAAKLGPLAGGLGGGGLPF